MPKIRMISVKPTSNMRLDQPVLPSVLDVDEAGSWKHNNIHERLKR